VVFPAFQYIDPDVSYVRGVRVRDGTHDDDTSRRESDLIALGVLFDLRRGECPRPTVNVPFEDAAPRSDYFCMYYIYVWGVRQPQFFCFGKEVWRNKEEHEPLRG